MAEPGQGLLMCDTELAIALLLHAFGHGFARIDADVGNLFPFAPCLANLVDSGFASLEMAPLIPRLFRRSSDKSFFPRSARPLARLPSCLPLAASLQWDL